MNSRGEHSENAQVTAGLPAVFKGIGALPQQAENRICITNALLALFMPNYQEYL